MSSKTPKAAAAKTKSVPKPATLLLVTTHKDSSARLFRDTDVETTILKYDADAVDLQTILTQPYDFVYFRDPFNDPSLELSRTKSLIEQIAHAHEGAYFIDSVSGYDDMLFEDKWHQYQRFSHLMPETTLLSSFKQVGDDAFFVKKRISSRSKGILFSPEDAKPGTAPEDYIVQPRLDIEVEYRVFVIGGELILPMATKRNKTEAQATRVTGLEHACVDQIHEICQQVYAEMGYDFLGLDIAKVHDAYILLEVNRSPQCVGYLRAGGPDLGNALCDYLSRRAFSAARDV